MKRKLKNHFTSWLKSIIQTRTRASKINSNRSAVLTTSLNTRIQRSNTTRLRISMIIRKNIRVATSKGLPEEDKRDSSMTHLGVEERGLYKDHVILVTSMATSTPRMNSTATTQASTRKMPKTSGKSILNQTQRPSSRNTANKVTFTKRGHKRVHKERKKIGRMIKSQRLICTETQERKLKRAVVTPKKNRISSANSLRVTCLDSPKLRRGSSSSMAIMVNLRRIPKIRKILTLRLLLIRLSLIKRSPKSRRFIKNTTQKLTQISTKAIEVTKLVLIYSQLGGPPTSTQESITHSLSAITKLLTSILTKPSTSPLNRPRNGLIPRLMSL